ncbi:MAG: hypothetical protein H0W08_14740 [Acidobacteria bacterium]|nr:hypothetical protein [Acidobacteriota bacterium]
MTRCRQALFEHLFTMCHEHAYLHRKEDDAANAGYWYRRAGHTREGPLHEEWDEIASALLA